MIFRSSTCVIALAAASVAVSVRAQVAPSAPAPSPAVVAADDTSGEIVVTAQRRAQRLVDVPVSVTTLSGETLARAGVSGLLDLTKTAPGVVLDKNGAYLQPTIRGIGTNVTGPGADPNVAIYVDGVYQSSQTGNFFELANVEDVEILKGPQGTLFGRNATGGAILIKLLDPSFTTSGRANLSYGRFNEVAASGYVTTALSDKLAVDLSAYYRRSDGWIHDLRTGAEQNSQYSLDIRSKLLFKPTDTLKFILSYAHNDTSDPTGLAIAAAGGNSAGRPFANSGPIATERGTLSND
ncbi:MAG: TonB-dependent receptor, partial [Janthinobacterium lividum]